MNAFQYGDRVHVEFKAFDGAIDAATDVELTVFDADGCFHYLPLAGDDWKVTKIEEKPVTEKLKPGTRVRVTFEAKVSALHQNRKDGQLALVAPDASLILIPNNVGAGVEVLAPPPREFEHLAFYFLPYHEGATYGNGIVYQYSGNSDKFHSSGMPARRRSEFTQDALDRLVKLVPESSS